MLKFGSLNGRKFDMYTTELIRKFPQEPTRPIVFVVYHKDYIHDAEDMISIIHGQDYLSQYVRVIDINHEHGGNLDPSQCDIWIDPNVLRYKNSWYN